MIDWVQEHQALLAGLAAGSGIAFVATLIIVPWIIIRIPPDYFIYEKRHTLTWEHLGPVPRMTLMIGKNALGGVFVLAGIAMLVLPGQGLLTILIGLLLLNFPGKYRLERWMIECRPIFRVVNRLRHRAGRPPLRLTMEQPQGTRP